MCSDSLARSGVKDSPLGQTVAYCGSYKPSFLFPIERQLKRDEIGLDAAYLPFVGEDVWNAYEISWLNPRGKPVVALGRFRIPAETPYLIESKSFKLYLNSFNQTVCADKTEVVRLLEHDLSAAAGGRVMVELTLLDEHPVFETVLLDGICIDSLDIAIDTYQLAPHFLEADETRQVEEVLFSHLLKSNCLVTGQPDWGMLAVRYRGPAINRAGLLRYVISFREHNEFHEQCVERAFCDILACCKPDALAVWACYTRRGGLDINPWRATPGMEVILDRRMDVRQ